MNKTYLRYLRNCKEAVTAIEAAKLSPFLTSDMFKPAVVKTVWREKWLAILNGAPLVDIGRIAAIAYINATPTGTEI